MKKAFRKGLTSLALAVGVAAAAFSGPALAGITWFFPITAFEDNDLAWVLKAVKNDAGEIIGYTAPVQTGNLAVGDRIVGVLQFDNTYPVSNPGNKAPITGGELTGVYDLTIVGLDAGVTSTGLLFAPTLTAAGGLLPGNTTAGLGSFIDLYFDTTPDLDTVGPNCASLAACVTLASNGDAWARLGFAGDTDEFFAAVLNSPNNANLLQTLLAANSTASVGTENFALSILENNTGIDFAPQSCTLPLCDGDGMIDVVGGGVLKGGQGLQNGAVTRSDVDAQVAPVPEPGMLALIASGLLGMGGFLRRRRS